MHYECQIDGYKYAIIQYAYNEICTFTYPLGSNKDVAKDVQTEYSLFIHTGMQDRLRLKQAFAEDATVRVGDIELKHCVYRIYMDEPMAQIRCTHIYQEAIECPLK